MMIKRFSLRLVHSLVVIESLITQICNFLLQNMNPNHFKENIMDLRYLIQVEDLLIYQALEVNFPFY